MHLHPHFHAFARSEGPGRFELGGPRGLFHRHMRPSGRQRPFDQGDLRLVALKLISEKPSHGYELIKAIEEKLGGSYAPSPGVIYPTLTLLEEMGAIRIEGTEGPRKLYAITPEGEDLLRQNQAQVDSIFARMAEMKAEKGSGPAPQIIRATENLKTALRLKVERGQLTLDQTEAIARLLDECAKNIEQA